MNSSRKTTLQNLSIFPKKLKIAILRAIFVIFAVILYLQTRTKITKIALKIAIFNFFGKIDRFLSVVFREEFNSGLRIHLVTCCLYLCSKIWAKLELYCAHLGGFLPQNSQKSYFSEFFSKKNRYYRVLLQPIVDIYPLCTRRCPVNITNMTDINMLQIL